MKTYKLQVVIFLSFLALFSLIVAGIVVYGYRSNSEAMLQSSDELLYQVSETIIRQTTNHLDPAHKMGELLKNLVERNTKNFESLIPIVEFFSFEVLRIYPQFSSIYYGDTNGNFVMCRRLSNGNLATKIISNLAIEGHALEKEMGPDKALLSETITPDLYDPRDRPWFILTRNEGKVTWSRDYQLFTEQVRGVTCSHPIYSDKGSFCGAIGIDFRLNDISNFLRSMKIGETGTAFILDLEGNVLAYPEQALIKDTLRMPRSPDKQRVLSPPIQHAMQSYLKNKLMRFTYSFSGENYIASFRPFPENLGRNWALGIIVPEDDFIGPIARIHETTLLFSFWLLIIAGFLTAAIAKELTDPINKLTLEVVKIKELKFEDSVEIRSSVTEIQTMANAIDAMKGVLGSFNKYVPSEIVSGLVKTGGVASVEAQAEKITLMFTDIENFSSITEKVSPTELVQQLSEYFDIIASIIYSHNGVIDKYIGDSVMAFWGAPTIDPEQERNACQAAIEMNLAITELNQRWSKENKMPLITRIGINTGVSLVGNFGSSRRFNYTAVGDSVNLASRLEGLNKIYGTKIMVSEDTVNAVKNDFVFRLLDLVSVKGREQSLKIYSLMDGLNCENYERLKQVSELTEEAFVNYLNRDWEQAIRLFEEILELMPDDFVSNLYIARSSKLQKYPPDEAWNGVFKVRSK
jgi:adenylate cyclase